MRAMTEDEARAVFVNVTDDDRRLLTVPTAFYVWDWDHLDFVGWRDPRTPDRGYLIAEIDGEPRGIMLRASSAHGRARVGLCNMCHSMQPGEQVALFSARRAGDAGARGDSVGTYLCEDVSCHDNVRIAAPLAPGEVRADVDVRIDGTRGRVERFVADVIGVGA